MKQEEWKSIPGYDGKYEISNYGRVKSYQYCKKQKTNERILVPCKQQTGYTSVNLYKDRKIKTLHIHRLVAEAFIPNPDNLPVINHKDENRENNYVENLEWCTHAYNLSYNGTRERIAQKTRKPILQLDKQGNVIKKWDSVSKASEYFGYTAGTSHIIDCLKGRHKTAHGFMWKYA